jgi:hypothetical protein
VGADGSKEGKCRRLCLLVCLGRWAAWVNSRASESLLCSTTPCVSCAVPTGGSVCVRGCGWRVGGCVVAALEAFLSFRRPHSLVGKLLDCFCSRICPPGSTWQERPTPTRSFQFSKRLGPRHSRCRSLPLIELKLYFRRTCMFVCLIPHNHHHHARRVWR